MLLQGFKGTHCFGKGGRSSFSIFSPQHKGVNKLLEACSKISLQTVCDWVNVWIKFRIGDS